MKAPVLLQKAPLLKGAGTAQPCLGDSFRKAALRGFHVFQKVFYLTIQHVADLRKEIEVDPLHTFGLVISVDDLVFDTGESS